MKKLTQRFKNSQFSLNHRSTVLSLKNLYLWYTYL